jgi:hypothetical protein
MNQREQAAVDDSHSHRLGNLKSYKLSDAYKSL